MTRTTTTILICVLSLVVLSTWGLYSALMLDQRGDTLWLNQIVAVGIGLLGFLVTAFTDHRRFERPAWVVPLYFFTLALLVAVLIPGVGTYRNGAQRWLKFFQPSELGKLALVVSLAAFGARHQHRIRQWKVGIGQAALLVGPFLALIFLEPDRGTTLFLGGISAMMLLVAGVRLRHMALAAVAALLIIVPVLARDELVRHRVKIFLQRGQEDQRTAGFYQNHHAMLAFGEGGLLGKGLGAGTMMRTIPEQHTDFILPVIGEELGLVGTLGVVTAFSLILCCGARIARDAGQAGDTFGLLLASGVTFLITAQGYFNIGIVTSMFPNKGLPLPFVSRGGTNIVVMLTLIGFLFSIARRTPQNALATKAVLRDGPGGNPFSEMPS
jgi:cell division protein FtsW